jgi:hypothetical protein
VQAYIGPEFTILFENEKRKLEDQQNTDIQNLWFEIHYAKSLGLGIMNIEGKN